jgi:hypothetical protein
MAKRKRAAALFEVFHETKSPSRSSSASRGYGWWFKGRAQTAEVEPTEDFDPRDPTTMSIRSPLLAPRIAAVEAMVPVPAPKPPATPQPATAQRPVTQYKSEPSTEAHEPLAVVPSRPGVVGLLSRFRLDRDTREVTMRLPLNAVAIGAFGLVLCIGLAYVMGRHGRNREAIPVAAVTDDNEDSQTEDLRPDALDVARHPSHVSVKDAPAALVKPPAHLMSDDAHYHDRDSLPEANTVHGITPIAPPADGPRIIGLNYLLIQNYPNQASATEARDFLVQNGIACTVEKVPPGFFCPDPNWMSVITSRGFDREALRSPEYDAFKRQIEKLGDKFAGNGKFKRFSLQVYKLK